MRWCSGSVEGQRLIMCFLFLRGLVRPDGHHKDSTMVAFSFLNYQQHSFVLDSGSKHVWFIFAFLHSLITHTFLIARGSLRDGFVSRPAHWSRLFQGLCLLGINFLLSMKCHNFGGHQISHLAPSLCQCF